MPGRSRSRDAVERVAETLGQGPHFDFNVFLDVLKADMSGRRAKLTAKRKKLLQTALAARDEAAEPVVKRVHQARYRARPDPGVVRVSRRLEDSRRRVRT